MRASAFISALVGAALGTGPRLLPGDRRNRPGRSFRRRNKVARQAAPGQSFTRWLYAKQAQARLARYGLDVRRSDGNPVRDPEDIRLMRNARKRERQRTRGSRQFWRAVGNALLKKHDERNLP